MAGPVAGWSALVLVFGACTSSRDEASTPPAAGDLEAAPVLCSDCELLEWAGGESSEFSGGNPICAIAASTVRPLSDPELAPMLAWVEGQRELSLRWHQNFVTDGVSGYAEQSSVVVDVRVMGARDVVLESGCSPNDELLLDLAIDLATSDGALRGTFTQSVRRLRGDDQFVTNLLQGEDPTLPLGNFRGSLDLDIDPTSPVGGVFIQLAFSPAGLRGRVLPTVSNAVTELWSPLEARFPDDGCGYNRWPVPMDRPLASL
ncbi:MAG TPA: hypothetical protein VMG12_19565, partial [Polyangiaceae bacterium]|nr:hypothetical protein [Polyangiaceae bacterium]